MRILKRLTGFILVFMMAVAMTGVAWAANNVTGTGTETSASDIGNGAGTTDDNGTGRDNTNTNGTTDNGTGTNGATDNVTGTDNNAGGGNAGENAKTGGAGGEISAFNNYGENGNYTALGEYEVAYGTELKDVTSKLPDTLTATLTTGEEVEVPVTWVCVSDNLGGTSYLPEHEDVTAVYTFEAQLGEGYTLASTMPEDYVLPFATVRYTEDAQQLNSNMESDVDAISETDDGMSGWTWIIWIVIIVAIVVLLWWLFAGNKGDKSNRDQA